MNNLKSYAVILLLVILGAGLGYLAGNSSTKEYASTISSLNEENARLNTQLNRVREKFPPSQEMEVVLGRITEKGSNFVMVKLDQTEVNGAPIDLFEEVPMTRKVLVDENTQIVKFVEDTQAAAEQPGDPRYASKKSYKEVVIGLNDLKQGDLIVVNAGKDVRQISEFTAAKIFLQVTQ